MPAATGTYSLSGRYPGVTEIQAGSYLLMDTDYQKCCADFDSRADGADHRDQQDRRGARRGRCRAESAELRARYPSRKGPAGLTTRRLTAEHGIIDLLDPAAPVQVGDRIEMWVHYSDATVNLHERIYGMRNGRVEEVFRVEG